MLVLQAVKNGTNKNMKGFLCCAEKATYDQMSYVKNWERSDRFDPVSAPPNIEIL